MFAVVLALHCLTCHFPFLIPAAAAEYWVRNFMLPALISPSLCIYCSHMVFMGDHLWRVNDAHQLLQIESYLKKVVGYN